MTGLAPFAWRSLRSRPLRTALSIVGIALGVAVLFAALAINAGIDAGVGRTVDAVMGQADLRIGAFEEHGLSAATVGAIRATPGVAVAAPLLEQRTYLQRDPLGSPGASPDAYLAPVSVIGVDPSIDGPVVGNQTQGIHDLRLVSGTSLPASSSAGTGGIAQPPSALLPAALARELGIPLGGTVTLLGSNGPVPFQVIGLLAGGGPDPTSDGRTVVIPLASTATLFGPRGASWIDVTLAPGATPDGVAAELDQRLTIEPYVLSDRDDLTASLRASTAGFQAMTALIAAVTLFGGAFLIFNTLSMTLAERVREIGLLRAAGTTRGQVHRLVLRQAAILGVAGSFLGLLLGYGLSSLVSGTVGSLGDNVPIEGPLVPPAGVVVAGAVGLLVTLAAALEPAIRAGRISPIETLRPSGGARHSMTSQARWLIAVVVTVGVAGLALWPLGLGPAGPADSGSGLVRPLLVYGVLLAVTLLTPLILGPLGRIAGWPFSLVLPAEVRLSRGSLVRDRKRTALTVGALTIGLAMIVALGGLAGNARTATAGWLTDVIPGDVVATSIRPIAPDEGVAGQLAQVAGVAQVSPIARFAVAFRGVRLDAAAMAGSDLATDGRLTFVAGDRRAALGALDSGGSTIVPAAVAAEFGLQVGDTLDFAVGGGKAVEERVVGIVARGLPGQSGESILLGWSDATERFGVLGADAFAIRYAPGQAAGAGPAVAAAATGLALQPTPLTGIEGAISDAFGRVFGLFDTLALLAVLIAGLGIINTLTMNVYERVREIGILRAAGMTRRQVWRMVVVEAGILGVVGAFLGCLAGVVLGFVLGGVAGLGGPGGGLTIPWETIALASLFGVGIAMLAAFQPARVASRISIVRAVQFE